MKIVKTLGLFLMLVHLSSCQKDDAKKLISNTKIENAASEEQISGEWKLVNVSGTIVGVSHDYPAGKITWTFDRAAHTIQIVNNNTNEQLQDLFPSGRYNYSFETNTDFPEQCTEIMFVNGVQFGCFSIQNGQLLMNQLGNDALSATFIR